jgi:hypothetical protein
MLRKAGLFTSGDIERMRLRAPSSRPRTGVVGGPRRPVVGSAPSDFRCLEVGSWDRLEAVIRLCDGVAGEGIGLDDVGARFEILAMISAITSGASAPGRRCLL